MTVQRVSSAAIKRCIKSAAALFSLTAPNDSLDSTVRFDSQTSVLTYMSVRWHNSEGICYWNTDNGKQLRWFNKIILQYCFNITIKHVNSYRKFQQN